MLAEIFDIFFYEGKMEKCANRVDLKKCWTRGIQLQKSASRQLRKSPSRLCSYSCSLTGC